MLDFTLVGEEKINPTVIKVVGCGGGGSNAVNRMIQSKDNAVEFVVINTDLQALNMSRAEKKIGIGNKLTKGLGAGGKPEVGERAAVEDAEALTNVLRGADMVFITAGMGGGTGTGAAPVVAKIAKSLGALTVAVVTKPFNFEGSRKMRLAEEGIIKLQQEVDTLIAIPNQNLMKNIDKKTSITDAFLIADAVLSQSVLGISDILTRPGLINTDFNDVRTTMEGKGAAIMGTGNSSGNNRAVDAATAAINNPMLEDSRIDGAKNVLVNITSGENLALFEIEEVMGIITDTADKDALIKYGTVIDPEMEDEISVTVIATGFGHAPSSLAEPERGAESAKGNYMDYGSYLAVTRNSLKEKGAGAASGKTETAAPAAMPISREASDLETPTVLRRNTISLRDAGLSMREPLRAGGLRQQEFVWK
ncbi:MAG: cell division protein FtsZ [Treponema sp.]|jgi:cell division protein FtsZ|nr:cell division protein FtsZ [Treponema sp.]